MDSSVCRNIEEIYHYPQCLIWRLMKQIDRKENPKQCRIIQRTQHQRPNPRQSRKPQARLPLTDSSPCVGDAHINRKAQPGNNHIHLAPIPHRVHQGAYPTLRLHTSSELLQDIDPTLQVHGLHHIGMIASRLGQSWGLDVIIDLLDRVADSWHLGDCWTMKKKTIIVVINAETCRAVVVVTLHC